MNARRALAGALLNLANRCAPAAVVVDPDVERDRVELAAHRVELAAHREDLATVRRMLTARGEPEQFPGERAAPSVRWLLIELERKERLITRLTEDLCRRGLELAGAGGDPWLRAENARQRATLLRYEELLVVCRGKHGGYDRREWLRILAGEPEPGELAWRT